MKLALEYEFHIQQIVLGVRAILKIFEFKNFDLLDSQKKSLLTDNDFESYAFPNTLNKNQRELKHKRAEEQMI